MAAVVDGSALTGSQAGEGSPRDRPPRRGRQGFQRPRGNRDGRWPGCTRAEENVDAGSRCCPVRSHGGVPNGKLQMAEDDGDGDGDGDANDALDPNRKIRRGGCCFPYERAGLSQAEAVDDCVCDVRRPRRRNSGLRNDTSALGSRWCRVGIY